ncbi:MAG: o-succinylbenzoate synthase [Phycicoccus sp.]|nr:o-succinylbenzoate synthase [Phycicoccus sp.]
MLSPLAGLLANVHVVALPLRIRFRGILIREAALFQGPHGWGEFAPFVEYGPEESSHWLASAIESAYAAWPAARRDAIAVNATVPAVGPEKVPAVLQRFPGSLTAKVKVAESGQSLADDLDRVAAVRATLGPAGRIRVDANGGWTVDQALDAIQRLAAFDLEYVEQPCRTVEELAELRTTLARNGIDVLIAADESIRKADDPLRVRDLHAADLIVVKVAPLGGVHRALDIVDATGLPAVVSSALDTSVGIAAGVALAAALPTLDHACGLGTVSLFEGDIANPPKMARNSILTPGRVTADPALLQQYAADPDRQIWWRDRIAAAYGHLAAR